MFAEFQGMEASYIASGIIWALVCGLAVGNYACSLIHRLPRGKSLLADAPYCGTCRTPLQVRDLFPVFSALALNHRCRYCKTPYPISHTVTEILVAALFILGFLQYGFGDYFVLFAAVCTFLIILATIQVNDGVILGKVIVCTVVSGMLLRVLADCNLFNLVLGGLFGVLSGAALWHKKIEKQGHIYKLPQEAELMAMAGICVGANLFPKFLIAFAGLYLALWLYCKIFNKTPLLTIPISLAIFAVYSLVS